MYDCITPLILTFNEEANLERTLAKLAWAREIVVLDSGSSDRTRAICAAHANVRVVERAFDSHANQWNHGLRDCGIATAWVLALDADYVLSDALVAEIGALQPSPQQVGFLAGFDYCVFGRPLRTSLYPPVTVLFRRAGASYRQDGHTQRLHVEGELGRLSARIFHDDRKPLARWLVAQDNYARLECELLLGRPWSTLKWQDKLRRMMLITPWLVPLYVLIVGRALFDGWHGWYYALHRGVAEAILALRLMESRLGRKQ